MKIAIMQPYIFPYIGYFQLIESTNQFVFYDDVQFIKGGWINRNRIILNKKPFLFTVPLKKASIHKQINEIEILNLSYWKERFFKQLKETYQNAPFYEQIMPMIIHFFNQSYVNISEMAIQSIRLFFDYINENKTFKISSIDFPHTKTLQRVNRIIKIVKQCNGTQYINSIGGKNLYSKEEFQQYNIKLIFIKPHKIIYSQQNNNLIKNLSIIDIMMNYSINQIKKRLKKYEEVEYEI